MKATPLAIPDVILLEPQVFEVDEVSSSKTSTKLNLKRPSAS